MVSGGMSCIKYLLFAFNLVFVIFGILLLYAGFSTVAKIGDYRELLEEAPNNVAIVLIIIGFAIFLLAFLGCCGAIQENSCMLTTFSAIVVVILLIELIGAGLVLAFKNKIRSVAEDGIKSAIKKYDFRPNQTDNAINKVLDDIQHNLGCCGAINSSDWDDRENNTETNKKYPYSCCDQKDSVIASCNADNVYKKGCVDALNDEIRGSFGLLGGIAISVAVVQLVGILFACSLSRSIRKEYEVV